MSSVGPVGSSPSVVAAGALDPLRVARLRTGIDVCAWTSIGLGIAFTAVTVQQFAAGDAEPWSLAWTAAWLLDPMVSLLLIAVLLAEQVTARWQVPMGWRVTATKWGCFTCTYVMNTWTSWREGLPSGVVLHSVPPLMILLGAEVAPVLRDRLTTTLALATTAAAAATAPATDAAAPVSNQHLSAGPAGPAASASGPSWDRVPSPDAPVAPPATVAAPGGTGPGHHPSDTSSTGTSPTDPVPAAHHDAGHDAGHDEDLDVVDDLEGAAAAGTGDGRVRVLLELLASGCEITGPQAAALLTHQGGDPVSARTARRLLAAARARRVPPTPTAPIDPIDPVDGSGGVSGGVGARVHLHLLPTGSTHSTHTAPTGGEPR